MKAVNPMIEVFGVKFNYIYLIILCALMIFDIITGIAKCYYGKSEKSFDGNFKSTIMKRCGLKKILTVLFMIGINLILAYFKQGQLVLACYVYYFIVEALSIFENLNACGIDVPKFIKNFIEDRKEK